MNKKHKEELKIELHHIFDSGANQIRVAEMVEAFIDSRYVVKNINYDTVLATVPYQCCPVCGGTGQTFADGFTNSVYQTCKVCNGTCVIPQHIVQQALDVDS